MQSTAAKIERLTSELFAARQEIRRTKEEVRREWEKERDTTDKKIAGLEQHFVWENTQEKITEKMCELGNAQKIVLEMVDNEGKRWLQKVAAATHKTTEISEEFLRQSISRGVETLRPVIERATAWQVQEMMQQLSGQEITQKLDTKFLSLERKFGEQVGHVEKRTVELERLM